MIKYIVPFVLMCGSNVFAADPEYSKEKWEAIISAIQKVETGGEPNGGLGAIGDNGKSLGSLQISAAAFQDAQEYDSSIKGNWEDCLNDFELSKKVFIAYSKRYFKKGDSLEFIVRRWNGGGPSGHKKKATIKYWNKFKKFYKENKDG